MLRKLGEVSALMKSPKTNNFRNLDCYDGTADVSLTGDEIERVITALKSFASHFHMLRIHSGFRGPGPEGKQYEKLRDRFVDVHRKLKQAKQAFEAGE